MELHALEVKAERIAAHSTKWTMPCMWALADDFDAVDDALAGDPSVSDRLRPVNWATNST